MILAVAAARLEMQQHCGGGGGNNGALEAAAWRMLIIILRCWRLLRWTAMAIAMVIV